MGLDGAAPAGPASRILLVEDDHDLRILLRRILVTDGHEVVAVADGADGLRHAVNDRFDIMLIDRGLPTLDGLDLTRQVRYLGIRTPVMILTGYGSLTDRAAGTAAGAEDYLVKPFDIDELLARIRSLLELY